MPLKLAHTIVVTPNRCGLYETTRELVLALREQGIDSRLVEVGDNPLHPEGYPDKVDRTAPIANMEWAKGADYIVNHSGYDGTELEKTSQPVIYVSHGRPRSSFLSEVNGKAPIYSYYYKQNKNERLRDVVTFWHSHVPYLETMFPDKPVSYVPSCVDINEWTMGISNYDFNGRAGEINIVCTDPCRDDVDSFHPLHAFALWSRNKPKAKLHLYAKPEDLKGYAAIIRTIQEQGNMGEIVGWTDKLKDIYRKADLVLTGNTINTRTVREAMACGCPVANMPDLENYESRIDSALFDFSRHVVRRQAENLFNPEVTAKQFIKIL